MRDLRPLAPVPARHSPALGQGSVPPHASAPVTQSVHRVLALAQRVSRQEEHSEEAKHATEPVHGAVSQAHTGSRDPPARGCVPGSTVLFEGELR